MSTRGLIEFLRAPITLIILTLALVEWVRGGHRSGSDLE
jgi:hypothetical protein